MQRAAEYQNWCGSLGGNSAVFKRGSETLETKTLPAITLSSANVCKITVNSCPNSPTTTGTFADNYEGASFSKDRCLLRADDYKSWCGSGMQVNAVFVEAGVETFTYTTSGGVPITNPVNTFDWNQNYGNKIKLS